MSLRFRRRVTIVPGVALNISKSGLGLSVGPRGAKVGIGPRGLHRSLGLPGTGLHFRKETTWRALTREQSGVRGYGAPGRDHVSAVLQLRDDGSISLLDEDGSPLPPRLARAFRDQNADQIETFLSQATERWNAGIDELLGIHLSTPDPTQDLEYEPEPFPITEPYPVVPRKAGILGFLWPPHRDRVAEANSAAQRVWDDQMMRWREERRLHDEHEASRQRDYEVGRFSDPEVMERLLADRLALLAWPRSTAVSYQVRDEGRAVSLDVDLPEIEDMPRERATPAARGLKINVRSKSDTQIRREYMQHIHCVLFRIIGEVFHTLPTIQQLVASGYSQRADPLTGHIRDDYLISARVERSTWHTLNFRNLAALDIVASFELFDLRRAMTKTGIFTPIDPHVEGDS